MAVPTNSEAPQTRQYKYFSFLTHCSHSDFLPICDPAPQNAVPSTKNEYTEKYGFMNLPDVF
jgi:hypothetical protein